MRKIIYLGILGSIIVSSCACSKQGLADMELLDGDEYASILWEERTYIPYCAISKSACGVQIGIVEHNTDDRVYEFQGYSANEWIISALRWDGGAMLWREINVVDIPAGLESEYDWNNP